MGLLSVGTPLTWENTKEYAEHVRSHGIRQLLNLYNRFKGRQNDPFYFGDEVEYALVRFDEDNHKAKANVKAEYYLKILNREGHHEGNWTPEYASYVVEGTPRNVYGLPGSELTEVEDDMKRRKQHIRSIFESADETILTVTAFPRIGCPSFTHPDSIPQPETSASRSLFFPDEGIIDSHPRFKTLTRNIRERRGQKIQINVPIFVDTKTPVPFMEDVPPQCQANTRPNHVYMDAMGFGMSLCCLQVTFQAKDITECRYLYDQLTPLTPVLMALSAATPIFKGHLVDIDHRWVVVAGSVDCRTAEERGEAPLRNDKFVIPKSRCDSIDSYLSPQGKGYNDVPLVYDDDILKNLMEGGMDEQLAQHFAHLFIRDTVSLFEEMLDLDDETTSDHFENIQSTNWQSMRFKPPPVHGRIGWRVEFRPMDCQLTDFENAAYTVFVVLLAKVILTYNVDMLIPMSQVEENLRRAQRRDAVLADRFYFDMTIHSNDVKKDSDCGGGNQSQELTIDEIINGSTNSFRGLIPLIKDYIKDIEMEASTRCSINCYMELISKRASGELMTTARYMREFVQKHPDYKCDSVVSEQINYDLLKECDRISKGLITCPDLLPSL